MMRPTLTLTLTYLPYLDYVPECGLNSSRFALEFGFRPRFSMGLAVSTIGSNIIPCVDVLIILTPIPPSLIDLDL